MILLVEDNPNARLLLARILSSAGHEVIESENGEEALNLLKYHRIDLVVTDLAMPKMTGFGLIAEIRARWPRLPVILITGYLSAQAAREVLGKQIEFIPKPIDRNQLIDSINRLAPAVHLVAPCQLSDKASLLD
jgi:DNA-binding NtrC family response regulator